MQLDAEALLDRPARMLDQCLDIGSACAPLWVDDKVGVFFRDARRSYRMALEPAGLDQPRGLVAGRIAEHRPRVGQVERLRFDASRQQLGDAPARLVAVSRPEA